MDPFLSEGLGFFKLVLTLISDNVVMLYGRVL